MKQREGRPRILLIAYACSPYIGSECTIGWNRAVGAARDFDVWVICGKREFERDVKCYIRENGEIKNLHLHFLARTRFEKWLWQLPLGFYLGYHLWQRRAVQIAASLNEKLAFRIVHQINWSGFRNPGTLWRLKVPFVWGPVGGTQNCPKQFLLYLGCMGAFSEGLRSIINSCQLRYSRRVRQALRNAAIILTSNSDGKKKFEHVHKVHPELMCEIGITDVRAKMSINLNPDNPLRILWSGGFKHHKALPLLLSALQLLPSEIKYELKILGKGPLERKWRRLCYKTGVASSSIWCGWLPYEEALQQYDWADVFTFTSLRDTTGNVVLEAISHGVPVICLDHQGAGGIITPESGIKIPPSNPLNVIEGLSRAIEELARDRTRLENLSRGAISRAEDYLWHRNQQRLTDIYSGIISSRMSKRRGLGLDETVACLRNFAKLPHDDIG